MNTNETLDATELPLYIAYQPVIQLNGPEPKVYAYEALLRVAPNEANHTTLSVITSAEENGSMPQLDAFIAAQVCLDAAESSQLRLWLNLSQTTLSSPAIAHQIARLIAEHDLACRISIEMTETADGSEAMILESLHGLKNRNVTVVLDDIEDGFAKSHLLRSDLIAGCKLSRRSTSKMNNCQQRFNVTSEFVDWCKNNGKTVVMEGVETARELAIAIRLGVDYCQGFYFWPALPISEIPAPGTRINLPSNIDLLSSYKAIPSRPADEVRDGCLLEFNK